jgi:hypothetical protein
MLSANKATSGGVIALPLNYNSLEFSNFYCFRGTTGIASSAATSMGTIIRNCVFSGQSTSGISLAGSENYVYDCIVTNVSTAGIIATTHYSNLYIYRTNLFSATSYGINTSTAGNVLIEAYSCSTGNNGTAAINGLSGNFYDCFISESTEVTMTNKTNGMVSFFNADRILGNHIIYYDGTVAATLQTTVTRSGDDVAWSIVNSAVLRKEGYPVKFKIADIAIASSSWATASLWVKKNVTTGGASFYVKAAPWSGLSYTSASKANDTNWEQLTINFSSSTDCVAQLYLDSWYYNSASINYIGSFTASQP